eukprot:2219210-Prorocentrum_lima.AAC.1
MRCARNKALHSFGNDADSAEQVMEIHSKAKQAKQKGAGEANHCPNIAFTKPLLPAGFKNGEEAKT